MSRDKKSTPEDRVVTTSCSFDCGARCPLRVYVSRGIVHRIENDERSGHMKACARGLAQRDVLYAPDRLKVPLKRIGERGSGKFAPVSWEEALDFIAGELRRVKDQYGPHAIFLMDFFGSMSALHNTGRVGRRFFSLFGGCTTSFGNTSLEAAVFSSQMTFGTTFTRNSRDNFLHSKLIILWGWNPLDTRFGPDTVYYLREAKKNGAKIICVDPRLNPTGKALAERWIPIRPGTDSALLIAMAYVMIAEDLYDRAFIDRHTFGFEKFSDYVMGREDGTRKDPAWAEKITGVPSQAIFELARDYAVLKPAALYAAWAPGRTAFGEQYHRAASTLAAMTGNIGVVGGHVSGGTDRMALGLLRQTLPVPEMERRAVHIVDMYDLLLRGKSGGYHSDIKILYVLGCDPLNQWLNTNKGVRALKKPEIIVVHDLFMTPTARYADIVLPVAHYLERQDLAQPWSGGTYNLAMEKAVEPIPQTRTDLEIFSDLAGRLDLPGYNDKSEEEWLAGFVSDTPGLPDYSELQEKKIFIHDVQKPWVAFRSEIEDIAKNPFKTPSGKIEIYSQKIAEMNNPLIPPIPTYIEPWEGPRDPLARKYPLQLVTPHSRGRVNGSLDNIPRLKAIADDDLWVNPQDAETRNIEGGESVRVFNDRGEIIGRVKVTDRIMSGVVSLEAGSWYRPDPEGVDRGGCVNVLTIDKKSPAGAFPCNSCLVEVEDAAKD